MMLLSAIIATSSALAITPPEPLDVFWQACTEGQVELPAGRANRIDFDDIPWRLRDYYRGSKEHITVHSISGSNVFYLINYDKPKPKGWEHKKSCGVVSKDLDLVEAERFVRSSYSNNFKIAATDQKCKPSVRWSCAKNDHYAFSFSDSDLKYMLHGSDLGYGWKLVQLSFISETRRNHLLEQARRVELQR